MGVKLAVSDDRVNVLLSVAKENDLNNEPRHHATSLGKRVKLVLSSNWESDYTKALLNPGLRPRRNR